jgi:monoamine oxidase
MKFTRKSFLINSILALGTIPLWGQNNSKKQLEEKIAIIGAGFSGLYAAHLLAQSGFAVEIFEASSRFGGRVRPLHDFADFPIELGAEEIHGNSSIYYKILRNKKVPLIKKEFENYYMIKGKLLEESEADLDRDFSKLQDLILSFNSYAGGDTSVEDYVLKKSVPKSYLHIAEALIGNVYGSNIKKISAAGIAKSIQNWRAGEEKFWIRNRSHLSVIEEICGHILTKIRYNTQITKVNYSNQNIELEDKEGNRHSATRVIVAVPLSILKQGDIHFSPSLPGYKNSAISKIGMGIAMKIILKFAKRFWEPNTGSIVGDGWITEFYPSGYMKSMPNNVLVGLVVGESAEKLSEVGKNVIKVALKELDSMFGKKIASRTLIDYFIMDWTKEPFIQGGFSFPSVGEGDAREKLMEPVSEKIFFAGEAANKFHYATIHGALESGERAAKEIFDLII